MQTAEATTTRGARALSDLIVRLIWMVAFVVMAFGTYSGYESIYLADSAPQQAAAGAMACFHVISPYVLARGLESLLR